ncbi:MAG TPA: putative toxin-antitoxin system toxin component, PIN family [Thermoanaerobaculia bacterium]|nr:putative toxin-antitoxin system toxin component, PIN family [Thermoanaerobaculia bacterium]
MTPDPAAIDTNVAVSGLLTSLAAAPTARILDGMLVGRFRFLISLDLLSEYRSVLLRQKIRRRHGLAAAEIDTLLTEIAANGQVVEIDKPRGRGAGTGDEHLWEILAAVSSALLVTGDRRLFEKPAGKGRVLTPRAFSKLLGER